MNTVRQEADVPLGSGRHSMCYQERAPVNPPAQDSPEWGDLSGMLKSYCRLLDTQNITKYYLVLYTKKWCQCGGHGLASTTDKRGDHDGD